MCGYIFSIIGNILKNFNSSFIEKLFSVQIFEFPLLLSSPAQAFGNSY